MTTQDGGNESSYPPPIAEIVTHLCINSKGPWDNTTKIISIIEDVEELDENQLKKKQSNRLRRRRERERNFVTNTKRRSQII